MLYDMSEPLGGDILTVYLPKRCDQYNRRFIQYLKTETPPWFLAPNLLVNCQESVNVIGIFVKGQSGHASHSRVSSRKYMGGVPIVVKISLQAHLGPHD